MPININDMKMPEHIDFLGFAGGFDYQDFRAPGETGLTHWWSLGDVNSIDVSNLLGFFNPGHNDEILAVKFPNNYELRVNFEYRASGTQNGYIQITRKLYDNNGNLLTQPPSISGVTWFGSTSMMGVTNQAFIYPHAMAKVFLNTEYYPQTPNSPAPPSGVKLQMLVSGAVTSAQWNDVSSPGNDLHNFTGGLVKSYYDLEHYGEVVHSYATVTLMTFTGDGLNNFNTWLKGNGDPFDGDGVKPGGGTPDVPAGGDDNSEPGGGDGNYDDTSDPIDFPTLPIGGAIECGAVTAHRVSQQTLEGIMAKLWDNSIFDIGSTWQKSIQDPMNAVVSLHALPISPEVDGPDRIWIGNFNTGYDSPLVTSQYVAVDCGSLTLKEFWGSALDYSPYTKVEIFLPFIGIKTLKTEDVMKTTIQVKYHIDVLTGDCAVFIKCGISVLYTYTGNCRMAIPLSSTSDDMAQRVIQGLGTAALAMGVAVGGAPVAGGAGAASLAATGATAGQLQSTGMLVSAAGNVASHKVTISRTGEMVSNAGLMGHFVPYLIIHRPVQSLAKDYNKFKGYTSNITRSLGTLTGYTEVEQINLQGIPNATKAEMEEIKCLLMSGVIF